MKYSSSFYYDLEFGEISEKWVKELFDGGYKVEVKSDRIANKTGNIYIEVYHKGNLSGISTTISDYWIYRLSNNDTAIIVSTKRLKELVKLFYKGKFTKGGDNNTSLGVLVPIKEIL
jgi:hypothetical protein